MNILRSNVLSSVLIQSIFESNALKLLLSEFIPCIFSSGMKEDRISTINILLSTLKTKVRIW